MPSENEPPIEGGGENCGCCELCTSAGDYQIVYCHQGEWRTLAAPTVASRLTFDPQLGIFWDPILAEGKRPEQPTTKGE